MGRQVQAGDRQPVSQGGAIVKTQIPEQVLNLSRYLSRFPGDNLTILSGSVLSPSGDAVAVFPTHIQAVVAVRAIREELAKIRAIDKGQAVENHMLRNYPNVI
jgi:hypothetical protein